MNVNHYHNLLVSLTEVQICTYVYTENYKAIETTTLLCTSLLINIAKYNWYQHLALQIVASGRVPLCRDKE